MYVQYYMSKNPVTVAPEKSIEDARQLLENYHFRHLPVVDSFGSLLGMVTDRDLRSAYPSTVLDSTEQSRVLDRVRNIPVSDIMSSNNIWLSPSSTLDDALLMFEKRTVGALPVVNVNMLVVGILSFNDLLKAWRSLFGLGEKGSALVAIEYDTDSPSLGRLVDVLEEDDISFTRMVRTDGSGPEPAMLYLRINTYNLRSVHKAIEKAGFRVHHPDTGPEFS